MLLFICFFRKLFLILLLFLQIYEKLRAEPNKTHIILLSRPQLFAKHGNLIFIEELTLGHCCF